jgi:hypothetical protein
VIINRERVVQAESLAEEQVRARVFMPRAVLSALDGTHIDTIGVAGIRASGSP